MIWIADPRCGPYRTPRITVDRRTDQKAEIDAAVPTQTYSMGSDLKKVLGGTLAIWP